MTVCFLGQLPGIVFGRGGAVGILMLLECEGEKYAVLTEQVCLVEFVSIQLQHLVNLALKLVLLSEVNIDVV